MSTTSLLREERERLYYTPVLDPSNDGKQDVLIYMLPGNPGLITYYQPFLSTLHTLLQSSPASQNANFYVCGYSFAGFETLPAEDEQSAEYPLRLRDLIKDTNDRLYSHIETHRSSHAAHERSLKVILMGHSVGAYILLELIQRHKENIDKGKEDFDLIGGILLFPTITHIAQSRSGMIASVSISTTCSRPHPLILAEPHIPSLADTVKDTTCGPYWWCDCQMSILPRANRRSLQHYQTSDAISRACSADNHPVHQEPDGRKTSFVRYRVHRSLLNPQYQASAD